MSNRKLKEFKAEHVLLVYAASARVGGPDLPRAMRIRKDIKALQGFISQGNNFGFAPGAPPTAFLQLKPMDLEKVWDWVFAHCMQNANPNLIDLCLDFAKSVGIADAPAKVEEAIEEIIEAEEEETENAGTDPAETEAVPAQEG